MEVKLKAEMRERLFFFDARCAYCEIILTCLVPVPTSCKFPTCFVPVPTCFISEQVCDRGRSEQGPSRVGTGRRDTPSKIARS